VALPEARPEARPEALADAARIGLILVPVGVAIVPLGKLRVEELELRLDLAAEVVIGAELIVPLVGTDVVVGVESEVIEQSVKVGWH